MSWRYNYNYYTPSKPIKVKEGVKVKSKRGDIGDTWWSQRWVRVLESFGWSNRLQRGKRYARSGQVISFDLKKGGIEAKVQGSVRTPYKVTIQIKPFQQKLWETIIDRMAQKAIFAAKLLAGEMPINIEEVFEDFNVSLFPKIKKDLITNCSCPDSANPCKHIAAVHYILAEEFDRDPFMIFALRGKNQSDITEALRKVRKNSLIKSTMGESEPEQDQEMRDDGGLGSSQPQNTPITDFWTGSNSDSFSLSIKAPGAPLALIKSLGPPSFWDAQESFLNIMGDIYAQVSQKALNILTGDMESEDNVNPNTIEESPLNTNKIPTESELIKLFEEETGKNAIWGGQETKNYLAWKNNWNNNVIKVFRKRSI